MSSTAAENLQKDLQEQRSTVEKLQKSKETEAKEKDVLKHRCQQKSDELKRVRASSERYKKKANKLEEEVKELTTKLKVVGTEQPTEPGSSRCKEEELSKEIIQLEFEMEVLREKKHQ